MDQQLAPPRPILAPGIRIAGVLALAVASALAAWLLLTHDRTAQAPATSQVRTEGPRIVTADGLSAIAALRGSPVYWAGVRPGTLYEVTETTSGNVFVRYLPSGTAPGDPRAAFLTVGTYPRSDAYGDVRAASRRPGAVAIELRGKGLAVYDRSRPTSVYVAYPGSTQQIEVYDPSAAKAVRLVESRLVQPVP
jgi:hypothetical protein